MTHEIRHNEQQSQFETVVDGHTGYAAYDLEGSDRIVFTHTIVPTEIEGRGVASAIVKHALDHARAKNLKVVPQCAYVAAYIKRHPEYEELLAER